MSRVFALFALLALVACSTGGPGMGEAEAAWIASGGAVQRLDGVAPAAPPAPAGVGGGYAWPGEPSVTVFAPIAPPPVAALPAVEEVYPGVLPTAPALVCAPGQVEARGQVVFFGPGSANINPRKNSALDEVAALWRAGAAPRLTLTGYASAEGAPKANLDLSARRAVAVAKALEKRGIPMSAMTVRAFGSARASGSAADARRVDIAIGGV